MSTNPRVTIASKVLESEGGGEKPVLKTINIYQKLAWFVDASSRVSVEGG